jgi:predicted dithiol-disulfide oxidoreductase (DUF899 family)
MTQSKHKVVSREEWTELRSEILQKEKQLTKQRDALTAEIRSLPWVKIEKEYTFDTTEGKKTFPELFDGKSQLFVYHFMFGPGAKEGCPSCTFWGDQFGGFRHHLPQRDVVFKLISRGPLEDLLKFRERMGWEYDWVSSAGTDFNQDFGVLGENGGDWPGFSVFFRDGNDVYHTYFATNRGLEVINPTYAVLDLVPKGRDESELSFPMAWIKHHDQY